jgi:hypothetical protein
VTAPGGINGPARSTTSETAANTRVAALPWLARASLPQITA